LELVPNQKIEVKPVITLRPAGPVMMTLRKRGN